MFLEDGRGLGIVQQTIVQTTLWGVVVFRTGIKQLTHMAVGKVQLFTKFNNYARQQVFLLHHFRKW